MLKKSWILGLLLAFALVISACAGEGVDSEGNEFATPGALETSVVEDNPLVDTPGVETPLAETAVVETPVAEATAMPTVEGAVESTAVVPVTGTHTDYVRLQDLLAFGVVNDAGELIGDVDEVVMGANRGQQNRGQTPLYLVVDLDDVLLGDDDRGNLAPIPLQNAQVNLDNQVVILNGVTVDRFNEAPRFGSDEWPDFTDDTWDDDFNNFWGYTVSTERSEGQNFSQFVRLSEVLDYEVYGLSPEAAGNNGQGNNAVNPEEGDELGEVEDVVINVNAGSGQNSYLVVEVDDSFLDLGPDKLVPVPLSQVQFFDDEDAVLVNNATVESFGSAPRFEGDVWPDFSLEGWDEEFRSFWTNNVVE